MNLFTSLLIATIMIAGCALKEPELAQPTQPQPKIITPQPIQKSPQVTTIQHPTPTITKQPIQQQKTLFHPTLLRFPTINHKILTMQVEDNILRITNPEYQGKDVVLYLFGRDCIHCRHEVKEIQKLSKLTNIKIIGVHAQKMIGDNALRRYAKQVGYNFDILSFKNDVKMLKFLDKNGLWQGGTPTHLRVDQDGNIEEMSLPILFRIYK